MSFHRCRSIANEQVGVGGVEIEYPRSAGGDASDVNRILAVQLGYEIVFKRNQGVEFRIGRHAVFGGLRQRSGNPDRIVMPRQRRGSRDT